MKHELKTWLGPFDAVIKRAVETSITYLTRGPEWGIPEGMVVLSLGPTGEVIEGTYPGGYGSTGSR